jgi:hypothetical protein
MQKEMQWAKQQRAEQVLNRLNNVDSRIQAFKEVQQQQRMAIAAIQKKVSLTTITLTYPALIHEKPVACPFFIPERATAVFR